MNVILFTKNNISLAKIIVKRETFCKIQILKTSNIYIFTFKFKPLCDVTCGVTALNEYFKDVKQRFTECCFSGVLH